MDAAFLPDPSAPPALHALCVRALEHFGDGLTVASSLGAEDMVVLDAVLCAGREVGRVPSVFVLDTGRLPPESHDFLERVREHYAVPIAVYFPDHHAVEALVGDKGPSSFLRSVEERLECCRIRKLEPLARALAGRRAWLTGLRREQSPTRATLEVVQDDPLSPGRLKLSPLCHWSTAEVLAYLDLHRVPTHPLHARGYPSIGCAPCTRAVAPGEPLRAGRWWWEDAAHKECGLHPGRRQAP
ncbi:MAG: phosphoadenylyl-sulfate reductase [Myxococcales bacterium]|nr:phosphoadenylyl-sulfate reductase [Myxococcales bacterium]